MTSINVTGDKRVANRLRGISRRVRDTTPALAELPEVFEDHVDQTFATQGASIGDQWKPLTRPYAARKGAMGGGGPLILSGSLKTSFSGGRYHVEFIGKNSMRWGTKHPVARLHHSGSPGRRVPSRPILIVTRELREEVQRKISNYVMRGDWRWHTPKGARLGSSPPSSHGPGCDHCRSTDLAERAEQQARGSQTRGRPRRASKGSRSSVVRSRDRPCICTGRTLAGSAARGACGPS